MTDCPPLAFALIPADPVVRAVLGALVLCVLIAAAFRLVASFRDYGDDDRLAADVPSLNPREMLRRGEISEDEYRKIQSRRRSSDGNDDASTATAPAASD